LKKKDEALSFATNQQVEHLDRLFEKKIMEVWFLSKKMIEKWIFNHIMIMQELLQI